MSERKTKQQELLNRLQARAGTLEFQDFKDWLALQLEEVKDNLLTCGIDEFQKQQGEAAAFSRLIRQLERRNLAQRGEA